MTYTLAGERKAKDEIEISTPADACAALERYRNMPKELFLVLTLNGAHEIQSIRIVSIGTTNRSIFPPREVFVEAIKDLSAAIMVGAADFPDHFVRRKLDSICLCFMQIGMPFF